MEEELEITTIDTPAIAGEKGESILESQVTTLEVDVLIAVKARLIRIDFPKKTWGESEARRIFDSFDQNLGPSQFEMVGHRTGLSIQFRRELDIIPKLAARIAQQFAEKLGKEKKVLVVKLKGSTEDDNAPLSFEDAKQKAFKGKIKYI